jgi:sugar lactone lactonase YvrE
MEKIKKNIYLLSLMSVVVLLGASGYSNAQDATNPDVVSFKKTGLYPEGIDWDADRKRFMVTSIGQGQVGMVTDDGTYTVFAQDQRMVSAVGIRIDAERDRVLVCNSDPGASKYSSPETTGILAGLAVFQLSTGNLIKYLNLAEGIDGGHFCNDIALDKDGTAYVTDSFSTIIYKVDSNYNVSVLISNERFGGDGFNLNGIVVKDDYLLVDKFNEGLLFKVPLDDPEKFTQVNIKETFPGADGLLWASDGSLILIGNATIYGGTPGATDKTFKLSSADNWVSAEVVNMVDAGTVAPTTGVVRDGEIYVLYSMLQVLFNPETETHVEEFEIVKQNLN